jgi:mannose-1-phosphate guanylyltransferase
MTSQKIIHAVILAGGKGTRFWPLSRENCPKQMLNIVGEDTLLRQTIKRLNGFIPLDNVWIITTDILSQDIRFHLKPLGSEAERIRFIVEPSGRNTAPAIALAAMTLNKLSSDAAMVVMPSDHIIRDTKQFYPPGLKLPMDISNQAKPLKTRPMRSSMRRDFMKNLI